VASVGSSFWCPPGSLLVQRLPCLCDRPDQLRRCSAYAVAEEFDIAKLKRQLEPTFYRHKKLMSDQVLVTMLAVSTL